MNVERLTMYHISRQDHWKVGDILTAGVEDNEFWSICKDYNRTFKVDGREMTVFEMINNVETFEVSQQNIRFLYMVIKRISKEYAFYVREQIFEAVRREYFPQLPSRQKCLWVCEEDQISFWADSKTDKEPRRLLTLELTGDLFCGDDYWLDADTFSSLTYTDRAHHYWAGELSDDPHKEFLFTGTAVVKAIEEM